ncbi:MAG: hypothetical protein KAQ83_01910 [Nanoarchaeota archaeon]|nr:hypothetical protein [Nanoarchaeota archaeon]
MLPLLPAHSEKTIPFGNEEVINGFKKGNCYPFAKEKRSYASITFSTGDFTFNEFHIFL